MPSQNQFTQYSAASGSRGALEQMIAERLKQEDVARQIAQQQIENEQRNRQLAQGDTRLGQDQQQLDMASQPVPEKPINVNGRMILPSDPAKVLADYSAPKPQGRLITVNQGGKPILTPEDQAAGMEAYQRPQAQAQGAQQEAGWSIQQVSDPKTNTTQLMRVNSRTGAAEPVALPNGMQAGGQRQTRLTAGQQEDLATMATVQDLGKQLVGLGDRTKWKGVGGLMTGTIREFGSKNLGTGTGEEVQLRSLIGNIKGTIAKLRGGTSFTPNEQRLLDTYTPGQDESSLSIKNKMIGLNNFIETKRKNTMQFAGAGVEAPGASDSGLKILSIEEVK